MVRVIFLGPPGSGKGTQAGKLAQSWNIPHISTGEILRSAVKNQTDLGQKAQSYMDRGELVPDQLVIDLVAERLTQSDAQQGWLLDGFPRNIPQAEKLDQMLDQLRQPCDRVILLDAVDEVVINRLLGRAVKENRQDDQEETIRRRLEVYREQTTPLIEFYNASHKLRKVDGDQALEAVTAALQQAIET